MSSRPILPSYSRITCPICDKQLVQLNKNVGKNRTHYFVGCNSCQVDSFYSYAKSITLEGELISEYLIVLPYRINNWYRNFPFDMTNELLPACHILNVKAGPNEPRMIMKLNHNVPLNLDNLPEMLMTIKNLITFS